MSTTCPPNWPSETSARKAWAPPRAPPLSSSSLWLGATTKGSCASACSSASLEPAGVRPSH
eukprot:14055096-Alexandrium_andersonii.AAC.1